MAKLLLILLVAVTGCYRAKARTISRADLGNPEATRIYNFMSTRGGKTEITSDARIDEAVIASLDPQQACFDLTIRTELEVDLHPSQWDVEINGKAGSVTEVRPRESSLYTTTVTSLEVVRERTTERGTTTVRAPVEREEIDGVIVRHARACGPSPAGDAIKLRVILPQRFGKEDWGQDFEWNLR